jgi:Protein of unknown function, DUF547
MLRRDNPRAAPQALIGLLLIALLGGFVSFETMLAPHPDPWPRWQANDPLSTRRLDHSVWDAFLRRYVIVGDDGVARVAYAAVTADDRRALDRYIDGLAAETVTRLSKPEQLAYWINLYNALTVRLVLQHPDVGSIRDIDISPGLFADGPWGKKLVEIEGEPVSLNDIEHRILRPFWHDPLLHYALNCAAVGCPNLQARAFTAETAPALMAAGARAFVNHPRGAAVVHGSLVVSSLYVWYEEDFGGNDAGVIAHLRRYADPALAAALVDIERIADHAYDWSLNAADAAVLRRAER